MRRSREERRASLKQLHQMAEGIAREGIGIAGSLHRASVGGVVCLMGDELADDRDVPDELRGAPVIGLLEGGGGAVDGGLPPLRAQDPPAARRSCGNRLALQAEARPARSRGNAAPKTVAAPSRSSGRRWNDPPYPGAAPLARASAEPRPSSSSGGPADRAGRGLGPRPGPGWGGCSPRRDRYLPGTGFGGVGGGTDGARAMASAGGPR